MPNIDKSRAIYIVVSWLGKRQIAKRPTTLTQMHDRTSIGIDAMRGMFEEKKIRYQLVSYAPKVRYASTEIFLIELPDSILEEVRLENRGPAWIETGITNELLRQTYEEKLGSAKETERTEFFLIDNSSPGDSLSPEQEADPYYGYRLTKEQYEEIKDELIKYKELIELGKKAGYSYRQLTRATGGDKMRYVLPSPTWQPYMYQGRRYYKKEVLSVLHEADKTYHRLIRARNAVIQRDKDAGVWKDPMKCTSRAELFAMDFKYDMDLPYYLIR